MLTFQSESDRARNIVELKLDRACFVNTANKVR
jgi:hypothetical protein